MATSDKRPVTRINSLGVPEHRHASDMGGAWHWAWTTHNGQEPKSYLPHKGIYSPDPRNEAEKKARVGHGPSHQKGYIRKDERPAGYVNPPAGASRRLIAAFKASARSAAKAKAVEASVEAAIDAAETEVAASTIGAAMAESVG